MIFQSLIYILEVLKWKKVAALEDNNRIDNWQSWQYFYLMNNLGFTIKAIRKASTHLTEEPFKLHFIILREYLLLIILIRIMLGVGY